MTLVELFTEIANIIRERKGTTEKIPAVSFPTEIQNLPKGVDTSDATAVADDVIEGKIAYAKGVRLLGTYVPTTGDNNAKMVNKSTLVASSATDTGYINRFLVSIPTLDLDGWTSAAYLFKGANLLENFNLINTSSLMYGQYMFQSCSNLETVPYFDISNITNTSYMFSGCSKLKQVPNFNYADVTNASYMFQDCLVLEEINLSTFNALTNASYMFSNCKKLKEITDFTCENITSLRNTFYNCAELETLNEINAAKVTNVQTAFNLCGKLANFGGFKDLGKAYTQKTEKYTAYSFNMVQTHLTRESVLNVINKIYDLNLTYDVANGGTLYKQNLILGANNLALITDEEKQIAIDKGWIVS